MTARYPKVHTPVEMLYAQVLMAETGYPAPIELVQDCYGKGAHPAPAPGWFWIGATPKAAADIRRRGLHVVGTVTTTFVPAQEAPVISAMKREAVPVAGSPEHVTLMLEESA